jgi:RNA polymerase sigma-70 factor (ECF subfamily)
MNDDDFALLDRWRQGDRDAGNTLFERHFNRLFRFFRTKVSRSDAEDLVARTLLGCVEGRDRFRGAATFHGFLLGIAKNQLFGHFRANARERGFDPASTSIRDLSPSPSTHASARDDKRLLLEALRSLPIEQQLVIELSYWQRLTQPEISRILDVPVGTVASRLRLATKALRDHVAQLETSQGRLPSTAHDLDDWARSLEQLDLGAPHEGDD